jgi:hypothetical protein
MRKTNLIIRVYFVPNLREAFGIIMQIWFEERPQGRGCGLWKMTLKGVVDCGR